MLYSKLVEDLRNSLNEKLPISGDAYIIGMRFNVLQRIENLEKYLEQETKEILFILDNYSKR
jgi:hypothetical protein